jgi:hypothetical protein
MAALCEFQDKTTGKGKRLSEGRVGWVQEENSYGCPWNLTDVEKLVIPPRDDPISRSIALLFRLILSHGEQASRERRERRRDVVILELVHPPALDRELGDGRRGILDRLDELGRLFVERMEVGDQLGIVVRERLRRHRGRGAQSWGWATDTRPR